MAGIEEKIRNRLGDRLRRRTQLAPGILLDLPFAGDAYPETFLLADVKMDGPLDHFQIHLFLAGEGLVGIFPFRGDRCRIIAKHLDGSGWRIRGTIRLEEIQASWKAAPIPGYA